MDAKHGAGKCAIIRSQNLMEIRIPDPSLIVLAGASGSGKSTFAARHFRPTEILSSDHCRALVADDENDQSVSGEAFEILHFIAERRLRNRRLVVVDATNLEPRARQPLLELAARYRMTPIAIVLDPPEALCQERNRRRAQRNVGFEVVRKHVRQLRESLPALGVEGFRKVAVLESPEAVEKVRVVREKVVNVSDE